MKDAETKYPMISAYAHRRLVHPDETKKASMVAVGYPETTSPCQIEKSVTYKELMDSVKTNIADQRRALQRNPRYSFTANANRLAEIADTNAEVEPGHAISAVKELNTMFGYKSPDELNIKRTSLIMEFKDLSKEELRSMAEEFGVSPAAGVQETDFEEVVDGGALPDESELI